VKLYDSLVNLDFLISEEAKAQQEGIGILEASIGSEGDKEKLKEASMLLNERQKDANEGLEMFASEGVESVGIEAMYRAIEDAKNIGLISPDDENVESLKRQHIFYRTSKGMMHCLLLVKKYEVEQEALKVLRQAVASRSRAQLSAAVQHVYENDLLADFKPEALLMAEGLLNKVIILLRLFFCCFFFFLTIHVRITTLLFLLLLRLCTRIFLNNNQ
jgi:hypothetical protein